MIDRRAALAGLTAIFRSAGLSPLTKFAAASEQTLDGVLLAREGRLVGD